MAEGQHSKEVTSMNLEYMVWFETKILKQLFSLLILMLLPFTDRLDFWVERGSFIFWWCLGPFGYWSLDTGHGTWGHVTQEDFMTLLQHHCYTVLQFRGPVCPLHWGNPNWDKGLSVTVCRKHFCHLQIKSGDPERSQIFASTLEFLLSVQSS